jgi:DnaJ-class molecular chaperone
MINYYQTLGVDRDATPDQVKRAYRKLASQHHPDKGGDKNKFQEIEEAYRTLSDPQKRAMHDNPGHGGQHGGFGNQGPFDFESIFNIFGTRFQHPGHPRQRQQARMSLWITLRDVAHGGHKTISVGTPQGTQTVEIDIPLGINDGDSVQYAGLGPGGMDLLITFRIHPDPQWSRQDLNLSIELTVSVWDLITGGETTLRDLLGNTLSLTVPPRTQPGTVFRLRGRGLSSRNGNSGDILVKLQARIPDSINSELLDLIRQNQDQ